MKRATRMATQVAMTMALATTMAACSSSSKPASSGSTGATSSGATSSGATSSGATSSGPATAAPIKIGVITDLTGAAASGFTTTEKGIKAYVDGVNATGGVNGHQITYVMADSTSTPTGALKLLRSSFRRTRYSPSSATPRYSSALSPTCLRREYL